MKKKLTCSYTYFVKYYYFYVICILIRINCLQVIHVTLTVLIISVATVKSDHDTDKTHGDLKSESSRRKIYEIISSHEDRKYGDHGGHEYEEGEIPRKSGSRKYKRYRYQPDQGDYYYVDQPKHSNVRYASKDPVSDKVYVVPNAEPVYAAPKGRYPAEEPSYIEPKKEYLVHNSAYKAPEAVYIVPKTTKDHIYRENVGGYLEDKTAPITIGKTARTVYPKTVSNTHYSVVDSKHPSEYLVLEGQKPPRPLIMDPKIKATYHHSQPEGHYSAPEHQFVLKPEVSIPVHYPAPVKNYEHYDKHHGAEEKGHHSSGHGYYNDNAIKKDVGHKSHGHHDISGHKAHSSVVAHHDDHGKHHNR